jgi:hypothetical protein
MAFMKHIAELATQQIGRVYAYITSNLPVKMEPKVSLVRVEKHVQSIVRSETKECVARIKLSILGESAPI